MVWLKEFDSDGIIYGHRDTYPDANYMCKFVGVFIHKTYKKNNESWTKMWKKHG